MPASADFLQTPLQFLKGVGPRKAGDFARAEVLWPDIIPLAAYAVGVLVLSATQFRKRVG